MERVREQGQIGVDVRVDETRRDDMVRDVEPPPGLGAAERAHRRDPIAPDSHVRAEPRVAGAVYYATACEHDVEHERSSWRADGPLGRGRRGRALDYCRGRKAIRMEALSRPMAILIDQPWLAALPGAVLLARWALSRRRRVLVAAIAWLLYVPYEYGMKWRVLCSGECNIRVDLLVVYRRSPCSRSSGSSPRSERSARRGAERGPQSFAVTPSRAKKSFPLSSTTMKAGKSSTSMRQTASMPSSGYSSTSTLRMKSCARRAADPPIEPR